MEGKVYCHGGSAGDVLYHLAPVKDLQGNRCQFIFSTRGIGVSSFFRRGKSVSVHFFDETNGEREIGVSSFFRRDQW
jgi:hypothetical protein